MCATFLITFRFFIVLIVLLLFERVMRFCHFFGIFVILKMKRPNCYLTFLLDEA